MFLLSRLSWEVLRIKFEEAKKKTKKEPSKIYFVKVRSFLSSRINYLRCYFHDLFAMLPIMYAILRFEFLYINIQVFHISLEKGKD